MKMMIRRWKIPVLILILLLAFGFTGAVRSYATGSLEKGTESVADGDGLSAENDRFQLKVVENYSGITILDKKTNKVWSSTIADENFDISKVNAQWKKKVSSLFQLNYTDLDKGLGTIINATLLTMDYVAEAEGIENGVRINYDLTTAQISLSLEITLNQNGFEIKIPDDRIKEYGIYSIVSLDLMQYFAGASDASPGYYFYPDGSGAIMEFQDSSHKNEKEQKFAVYGDIEHYESFRQDFEEEEAKVMLPVFGAKMGENGFLAIISEREEASNIVVNCSNDIIPVNALWCQFQYRRGFDDPRVKEKSMKTYDKERITGDREIIYRILEEGDTDYSAMARNYRSYLMEIGQLTVSGVDDEVPLFLDIFQGTVEPGLLYDEFIPVTTFSQAEEMLKTFSEAGITDMKVALKGWTKNGYGTTPIQFPVNSSLGGEKGLGSLLEYGDALGIPIYLAADFIEAKADNGGYSKRNDVVYTGNLMILTDQEKSCFLLSPDTVFQKFKKFLKSAEKLQVAGISFEALGDNLYYNYNDGVTEEECLEYWLQMFDGSKEVFGSTIISGGNAYVIGKADLIADVPTSDLGYQFTTRAVPFYQMVVHGSAGYTGTPGNLSSDLKKQKLKWIEYGYLPYFELTYDGSQKMMYTEYNQLFSSCYRDWIDEITEIYQEMKEELSGLWSETIEEHEQLAEGVYRIIYSDGTKVYVNYNNEEAAIDEVIIEALDYTVVRGN